MTGGRRKKYRRQRGGAGAPEGFTPAEASQHQQAILNSIRPAPSYSPYRRSDTAHVIADIAGDPGGWWTHQLSKLRNGRFVSRGLRSVGLNSWADKAHQKI